MLNELLHGFSVAVTPENLLFSLIGCLIGTITGVLPGIGPSGAIAILLPLTFKLSPATAIIMLAGIYYGAMYGGSTTSILMNVPGEAASVVTCLDGYKMARQGRAGPALGISAFGSLIGATFSIVLIVFLAVPIARLAIQFMPPEYVALLVLALIVLTYLSRESVAKALVMAGAGLFLGTIGMDVIFGIARFTFGSMTLLDGVGIVPVAVGLFGLGEVLWNLERIRTKSEVHQTKIEHLLPSREDWKASAGAIGRGSIIGFLCGILPGGGAIVSSFAAYAVEKRLSRHPERFGKGAIEGVAAPETANNAAAQSAFIPLFCLGVPSNVVMAILLGAFIMNGLHVGPLFINRHPDLFWGVVANMYVANILLLVLNLPLIPLWVRLLRVPYVVLLPVIVVVCIVGAYGLNNNIGDVYVMIFFGVFGYLVRKNKFDEAPLVMALVIGPLLETNLRQSLLISQGSLSIFVTRPVSALLLVVAAGLMALNVVVWMRRKESAAWRFVSRTLRYPLVQRDSGWTWRVARRRGGRGMAKSSVAIEVTLFGPLRNYLPAGPDQSACKMEVDEGFTVGDLIGYLRLPDALPVITLVNSVKAKREQRLQDGDMVVILPPIDGG